MDETTHRNDSKELNPREAEILRLLLVEGVKLGEIATREKIDPSTVYRVLHRRHVQEAKARMARQILDAIGDDALLLGQEAYSLARAQIAEGNWKVLPMAFQMYLKSSVVAASSKEADREPTVATYRARAEKMQGQMASWLQALAEVIPQEYWKPLKERTEAHYRDRLPSIGTDERTLAREIAESVDAEENNLQPRVRQASREVSDEEEWPYGPPSAARS